MEETLGREIARFRAKSDDATIYTVIVFQTSIPEPYLDRSGGELKGAIDYELAGGGGGVVKLDDPERSAFPKSPFTACGIPTSRSSSMPVLTC